MNVHKSFGNGFQSGEFLNPGYRGSDVLRRCDGGVLR
jgi:hypothetical protein